MKLLFIAAVAVVGICTLTRSGRWKEKIDSEAQVAQVAEDEGSKMDQVLQEYEKVQTDMLITAFETILKSDSRLTKATRKEISERLPRWYKFLDEAAEILQLADINKSAQHRYLHQLAVKVEKKLVFMTKHGDRILEAYNVIEGHNQTLKTIDSVSLLDWHINELRRVIEKVIDNEPVIEFLEDAIAQAESHREGLSA